MAGYNSSIFAYGQTGAGKTYTMQGRITSGLNDDKNQVYVLSVVLHFTSSSCMMMLIHVKHWGGCLISAMSMLISMQPALLLSYFILAYSTQACRFSILQMSVLLGREYAKR
jgi:hypothetical protein